MLRIILTVLLLTIGGTAASAAEGDHWWQERMAAEADDDEITRHEPRRHYARAPRPDPAIMAAQLRLQDAGHQVEADGLMGPATRAALARFQLANELPLTGTLDERTKAALREAPEAEDVPGTDDAVRCRAVMVRSGEGLWREAQLCFGGEAQ